jgi:sensor histidine kinase regulating citrate/malate metabolism
VAAVVFVILAVFAVAVGTLTAQRLRTDFNAQVASQAQNIASALHPDLRAGVIEAQGFEQYASIDNGVARILAEDGTVALKTPGAP